MLGHVVRRPRQPVNTLLQEHTCHIDCQCRLTTLLMLVFVRLVSVIYYKRVYETPVYETY